MSEATAELAIIPRGASCADLGLGGQQITLPGPVAGGTYALDGQNALDLTYYDETETVFYFNHATLRINGVLVSIGERTLMWDLPGGADAWPSLHGPTDPDTGAILPADEIAFCFDYQLRVQPSPYTYHQQQASWSIARGAGAPLVLNEGQSGPVTYDITVTPGAATPAGQYVSGPVFVHNESPHAITVGAVTTTVGNIAATITCPTGMPLAIAPYTSVECAFHADVPDTSDRNVVGGASVSHHLLVSTQQVVASFAAANTATVALDDCVIITDDAAPAADGFVGTVCRADGATTFHLAATVGPFACGAFSVPGTARCEGLDTGDSTEASSTATGEVVCAAACTQNAAYWQAHSQPGGAAYDATWSMVGSAGGNTAFFRSGGTYRNAMSQLTLLNPYWPLARAYIAAKLNQLAGAPFTPAVAAAFADATAIFTANTPTQVLLALLLRPRIANATDALDDFNDGRIGPGRCH